MIRLIIIHVLYHDDNDITNNYHAILLKMSTLWININCIDICSPFMKLGILYDFVHYTNFRFNQSTLKLKRQYTHVSNFLNGSSTRPDFISKYCWWKNAGSKRKRKNNSPCLTWNHIWCTTKNSAAAYTEESIEEYIHIGKREMKRCYKCSSIHEVCPLPWMPWYHEHFVHDDDGDSFDAWRGTVVYSILLVHVFVYYTIS